MAKDALWTGCAHIRGSTKSQRMAMLTFSLIGLQFTWGVEMTYFTPHLLQLGLAKSQTSLVWIAPPLSGLIIQPIIGTVSDSSRLRWGRRRPYMLSCSIAVAACLCTLAWSSEIVHVLARDDKRAEKLNVGLAIFCIYAVDFAINAVQATARSLIVDTLPESQQQLGSAWAGRMLGLGHVLGYFIGTVDLMSFFGTWLGGSQFKQICVIASTMIISCTVITCYCVEERVLVSKRRVCSKTVEERRIDSFRSIEDGRSRIWTVFTTILATTLHLPSRIQAVCWITFWSWIGKYPLEKLLVYVCYLTKGFIGWSPFFVYGTTWVGETYYRQDAKKAQELDQSKDVVGDIARKGSLALVLFSLISFAGSVFLPWVVESSSDNNMHSTRGSTGRLNPVRSLLQKHQMAITTAWGLSQLAFACSMILAPFSKSFAFSTTLIAFCGIPWAMYGWAPLAILGEEINRLEDPQRSQPFSPIDRDDDSEVTRLQPNPDQNMAAISTTQDEEDAVSPTAGIYLGIWNIFATIPQFLATFIAMITFSILEPGKSPELSRGGGGNGDDTPRKPVSGLSGTAVCLAIGAVCSFVAAVRTFRLRRS